MELFLCLIFKIVALSGLNTTCRFWHHYDSMVSMKTNYTEMKKSELNFFKVLIGLIYVLLAVLIVVAFTL